MRLYSPVQSVGEMHYILVNDDQVDYFSSVPGGTPEAPLIEWATQFLKPGKTFIDVGAHCGTWSLFMAAFADEPLVVSFEAQLSTYYQLCGGIALNGFQHIITAHHVALGKEPSAMLLNIVNADGGGSSIQPLPTHTPDKVIRSELVDVDTLDRFGIQNVGLIKIDVEGNEANVLRGARKTIERDKPTILLESWDPKVRFWAEDLRKDTLSVLLELGYDVIQTTWPDMMLAEPSKRLLSSNT